MCCVTILLVSLHLAVPLNITYDSDVGVRLTYDSGPDIAIVYSFLAFPSSTI